MGLLEISNQKNLAEFLKSFLAVLNFFDAGDKTRIKKLKKELSKQRKVSLQPEITSESVFSESIVPIQSQSSLHQSDAGRVSSFRNRISLSHSGVPSSRSPVPQKTLRRKSSRFGNLISSIKQKMHVDDKHKSKHDDDDDDDDDFSDYSWDELSTSTSGDSMGTGITGSNSGSSISQNSLTNSRRGLFPSRKSSISNSSSLGTGTYTMGQRSQYFSNFRAPSDAASLSAVSPTTSRSEAILFDSADLPFEADPIESLLTLYDMLSRLYRMISADLLTNFHSLYEMNELEITIALIEESVCRVSISDELLKWDRQHTKAREGMSAIARRAAIDREIIKEFPVPVLLAPTSKASVKPNIPRSSSTTNLLSS